MLDYVLDAQWNISRTRSLFCSYGFEVQIMTGAMTRLFCAPQHVFFFFPMLLFLRLNHIVSGSVTLSLYSLTQLVASTTSLLLSPSLYLCLSKGTHARTHAHAHTPIDYQYCTLLPHALHQLWFAKRLPSLRQSYSHLPCRGRFTLHALFSRVTPEVGCQNRRGAQRSLQGKLIAV